MADVDENAEPEPEAKEETIAEEQPSSSPKKKAIIIGAIIFVVLLIQIATAFFFVKMIKGEDPSVAAMEKLEKDKMEKKKNQTRIGAVLEEAISVTVNIAGTEGNHYLKAGIQLEWDEGEHEALSLPWENFLKRQKLLAKTALS